MAKEPKDRSERFTDHSADHVKVGPKTAKALEKPKTQAELDALIGVVEDDLEDEAADERGG